MLLAFLTCDDPLSQWFKGYVQEAEIAVDTLLERRKLRHEQLAQIAMQSDSTDGPATGWRQTASARSLFRAANDLLKKTAITQSPPLDVRHMMGAYIYRPARHEEDLTKLNFNRVAWSNNFLGQINRLHPQELEAWKKIHLEIFPSDPPKLIQTEGPSTHIATDLWTLNDSLGYRAYAYAIYRFMTHKQTKAPLTISIQAPWGGGKTSLMRMIQQALDPDALREVKEEARQKRGEFTVRQALKEIENWIERKTQQRLPATPEDQERKLLTVWFNAWKYESASQVWAGLVDTIMHQVAARLTLPERERFWLLLNLKRVDADKLRHRIYERILRYWWRWLWLWLLIWTASVAGGLLLFSLPWKLWFPLPAIGSVAIALIKFVKAQYNVKKLS